MKTCVIDLFTLPQYAKEAYAEISESLRLFFACAASVLCAGSGITVTRYAARDG